LGGNPLLCCWSIRQPIIFVVETGKIDYKYSEKDMVRPKKAVAKPEVSIASTVDDSDLSEPIVEEKAETICIQVAELSDWMAWRKLEELPMSVNIERRKQSWANPEIVSVTCIETSTLTGDKVTRISATSNGTKELTFLLSKRVDAILMGDRALVRTEGE